MILLLSAWLFAAQIQTIGPAQPPGLPQTPGQAPLTTAAISGVVVDAETDEPVAGAMVSLELRTGTKYVTSRQVTDLKGRFAFANLPDGDNYLLTAGKSGYLDGRHTTRQGPVKDDATPSPIALTTGEWMSTARIPLQRPGAIGGRVVDERGEPVVGVYVRLLVKLRVQGRDELAAGPLAITDDRGVYRFPGLMPGRYLTMVPSVQASTPLSASTSTGQGPGRGAVDLPALDFDAGRLVLSKYPTPPAPINGRMAAYPPAFHPSGMNLSQATAIEVKPASSQTGADIQLTPVPTSRLTGTVIGPEDALNRLTLRLLLAGLENLGIGGEVATALVGADGRFAFLNVPAGAYVIDSPRMLNELALSSNPMLESLPSPPGHDGSSSWSTDVETLPGFSISEKNLRGQKVQHWVRMPVEVSGREDLNVSVTLRPLASMSGQVIFEKDPAQPDAVLPSFLSVMLDPADATTSSGVPRGERGALPPDFFFSITDILPGEYFVRTPAGVRWAVKSVSWNGRDYANAPLDAAANRDFTNVRVTVTNAIPTLTGYAKKADGTPATGATVLVFPIERAQWSRYGFFATRLKSSLAGTNGSFQFGTLPAGRYFVVAIDDALPAGWRDAEFLEKAQRSASEVTLSWGQTATIDVTVKDIR